MTKQPKLPPLYKQTVSGNVQIWSIEVDRGKNDVGIMVTRYGLLDGKIQEIRETISEGKNVGRKNETTPYEQACFEAKSRWEKQHSRKGYGLDSKGEESGNKRSMSPMLAQVYNKQSHKVNWDDAYAQPKLDGFRCMARRVGKKIKLFSREGQPMPAVQHIADALKSCGILFYEGLILDGELYLHGLSLNKISSACKKKGDLSEKIQYHVYDMIAKREFAFRMNELTGLMRPVDRTIVQLVDTVKVRSENDLKVCQKEFLEDGYEGAMLRHGRVGYEAGKRSSFLLKYKNWHEDEFVIIDFKMGRGKYDSVPIYTCTTAQGNDFDVLAPGDMEEKLELGRLGRKIVGKRLTVRYQNYTNTDEPVPFLPVAIVIRE